MFPHVKNLVHIEHIDDFLNAALHPVKNKGDILLCEAFFKFKKEAEGGGYRL